MGKKSPTRSLALALITAALALLTAFSGLPRAEAGIIFAHGPGEALTIQAEDFSAQNGVSSQRTLDHGGGENIGWIHDGDWTEYHLDLGYQAEPDVFTSFHVSARVASKTGGGTINMTMDGVHVGSLNVNGTGAWQSWTTVATGIILTEATGTLRLTYNDDRTGSLMNINWLELTADGSFVKDDRELAVDQMVTALESYRNLHDTFSVTGGDNNPNGQGWAFYKAGSHLKSTADVLIEGGHLPYDPLHDWLWTSEASVTGDVLIYNCRDRVGVFSLEGTGDWANQPSAADRHWWDSNDCNRYPIDQLGANYFAVSSEPSPESEMQRQDAVHALIAALESYGAAHNTYRVEGSGSNGNGNAWAFYEGGSRYPRSIANALIEGGHLAPEPLHDPLWISQTAIAGDVLVYQCKDRVAVFTREGDLEPSTEDRQWWDANDCFRYPIDHFGVSYYALSRPL